MSTLTDKELSGLDPIIDARKMKSDVDNNKGHSVILTQQIPSIVVQAGDNTGLTGGEGLSLDALMKLREDSLKRQ